MNNIITQTKTLHAEMKTMKSAWDSDTSAKQKAAQQTKMLKDQIALQEQKLAQANNMLDKATAKYGENSNQALRWRQAVANARTELNNLNNELRNTPNQLQALGQDMQATGDKIQNVGKAVTSVGKTMTTHVTALRILIPRCPRLRQFPERQDRSWSSSGQKPGRWERKQNSQHPKRPKP